MFYGKKVSYPICFNDGEPRLNKGSGSDHKNLDMASFWFHIFHSSGNVEGILITINATVIKFDIADMNE